MDAATVRPHPQHHMKKRARPTSASDQPTPTKMHESNSNLSTPTGPPEPKKRRGRPPGSSKKKPVHTAISPAVTISTRNPLLKDLVAVFGRLVAVLEFMDKNRKADQRGGVIAPVHDPDSADESSHGLGDDAAAPIDLTSELQQILSEVGEPGSVNSAKGAASEEATMNTQGFDGMTSQLVGATDNPPCEKEKESVTLGVERSQASDKGSPKVTETQAALQTSNEAEAVSSVRSEGEK